MTANSFSISSKSQQKTSADSNRKHLLVLADKRSGEPFPALSVYLTDSSLKPLSEARVDERGHFDLSEEAALQATYIVIAPQGGNDVAVNADFALLFRSSQLLSILRHGKVIELARPRWERLLPIPSWLNTWLLTPSRARPSCIEDRKGQLEPQDVELTRFCRIKRSLPLG